MRQRTLSVGALYAALDACRQRDSLTWRGLARELGLSPSVFTRMSQGRPPDADTLVALADWIGVDPRKFLQREPSTEAVDPDVLYGIAERLAAGWRPTMDEAIGMLRTMRQIQDAPESAAMNRSQTQGEDA